MEACLHFRGAALNARSAGVFWLLEEEILHKERRDFVRRQNRGISEILGGGRLKSPDLVSDKQTAQWAFAASSSR